MTPECPASLHDTHYAYRKGCTHPAALAAARKAKADQRRRRRAGISLAPHPTHRDVDEVAVLRAVRGDRGVRLGETERRIAVDLLTQRGLTTSAIAEMLGVTPRTVTRLRAAARRVREAAA